MDAILTQEVFEDFGTDPYLPFDRPPLGRIAAERTEQLRQLVCSRIPKQPGVYGMIDAVGRLVYVGKSKLLRNRLLSYFFANQEDEKAGRIIQSAVSIVWEVQPSEFAALLREQQLIRTHRPRYNVQGIPNRQKSLFLCLGRNPAPMFYVDSEADARAIAWEGPLIGAGRVRRAADVLNRMFLLRDCSNQTPMQFLDQKHLFDLDLRAGCVRHEMKSCLGPCAQGCSRRVYQNQVDAAEQFLRGKSEDLATQLELRMRLAAERLHFEQAARFHADMQVIQWLMHRLADHARVRNRLTCIYPCQGHDGRHIWYFVRRGVVEHAIRAPKQKRSQASALRAAEHWLAADCSVGTRYQRREETLAIIAGWFRKFPEEHTKILLPNEWSASSIHAA